MFNDDSLSKSKSNESNLKRLESLKSKADEYKLKKKLISTSLNELVSYKIKITFKKFQAK